jgi:hypothetical protein
MMQRLRNLWRFRWARSLLISRGNPKTTLELVSRRASPVSWTFGLSPHSTFVGIGVTRMSSRTQIALVIARPRSHWKVRSQLLGQVSNWPPFTFPATMDLVPGVN